MAQAAAAAMRKEWGQELRAMRKARGLTQAQLAELVGVDQATVSRTEAGEGGFESYLALAGALDVELKVAS